MDWTIDAGGRMIAVLKIAILVGLLKLYVETEKPLLCAGIFAFVTGVFLLLGNPTALQVLAGVAAAFAMSVVYFGLLSRFDSGSPLWWVILVGGFAIGFM
jgi:hypothetical protein